MVLPADQAIDDEDAFRAALAAAADRASDDDMVTLGIQPTEPATGYGYVIAQGPATSHVGRDTYRVERFEEKPTPDRAEALIASGAAYWNAGIFVWRRGTLIDGLERYARDISDPIREHLGAAEGERTAGWPGTTVRDSYADLRATSIDYALLEPASLDGRVAVVPAAVGWSDLGSWSALRDHRGGDAATVVTEEPGSRVITIGGRDTLIHAAGGRTIAVVGLEDMIVVDTPDALLISTADAAQDVKQVVDRLKSEGRDELS